MKWILGSIASNLVGIALLAVLVRKAREAGFPRRALGLLAVTGGGLLLPVIGLQLLLSPIGELPAVQGHPLLRELLLSVVQLAFVEEFCKFCGTAAVTRNKNWITGAYSGMLAAAVAALSFGIAENILFAALSLQEFSGQFWMIMLLRAGIGAPGHGAYGVLMGNFYGKAKAAQRRGSRADRRKNQRLAIGVPIGLHGLYDWMAGSQILKWGDTNFVTAAAIALDGLAILCAYGLLFRAEKEAGHTAP